MKKANFTQRPFMALLLRWTMALVFPVLGSQMMQAQYTITACSDAYENIQATGALVAGSAGDDVGTLVALPFTFNFYGVNYNDVTIVTNGFMRFTGSNLANPFTNAALVAGNNGIFPHWDDFNGAPGVFTQTLGVAPNRRFIIQWVKPHFGVTGDVMDFQAVLFETSNIIQFRYLDLTSGTFVNGNSATIGIAGPVGTTPSQVAFNVAGSVVPGQCIQFNPPPPCILTGPGNIVVNSDPGICGANVNYTITATTTCGPVTVTPPSGSFFPVGTTLVTATSGLASINFTVTVQDNQLPVITCPQDIAVTLDPGACEAFVNYNVTATDNCPVFGPAQSAQFPATILPHGGGAITVAGNNLPGGFFFNLTNNGATPIQVTGYQVRFGSAAFGAVGSPQTVRTYYTTTANTFVGNTGNAGAWTSSGIASVTVAGPNSEFSQVNLTAPFQLAPGQTRGIHLWGVNASLVYNGAAGFIPSITVGQLTLTSGAAAQLEFTAAVIANRTPNVVVQYAQPLAGPVPMLTSGLPSGDPFPVGTTQVCYKATDQANNMATCCFNVTVNNFPTFTTTLVCNDLVQISLAENCRDTIGADMILEGGPYRCYDEYVVMVLNPLGGFPVFSGLPPNVVDDRFIGPEWTVKVTDPLTNNSCWGKIIVEDKIPPTISCIPLNVPCTADLDEVAQGGPNPGLTAPQSQITTGINNPIGEPGAPVPDVQLYNFDFSHIPPGCPVADVDVRIRLTGHTFLPDLNIEVISPSGTVADVFTLTGCTGAEWPIDVTFDDEGAGGLTMCVQLNVGGANIQPVVAPGASGTVLFVFDGEDASGTWTVRIADNVGLDDGVVEIVGLIVTPNCPAVIPADNCSNVSLDYVDAFTEGNCVIGNSGTLIRTWTVTDAQGNTATCNQTITLERPTLADVLIPEDIKWTCDQYEAYPNVIEATPLHPWITDTDPATEIIDVNLDPDCDDADFTSANGQQTQDDEDVNSTNVANGGNGCPGAVVANVNNNNPNAGLDDADILELTGSGLPTIDGKELVEICGIGWEYDDLWVPVCPGTFKIIRQWTLIDWCTNPVSVVQLNQVIKVVDEEAPAIDVIVQDTFHQVYTLGQPAPIFCNGQNITIPALTLTSNPNQLLCANTHYEIGDTLEVVFNPPTSQNVVSWTIIEDVIHVQCPTPPIGQPGSTICQVKLKLRRYTFSSQATIDVYDASSPTPGGPHGVCQGTVVINQYNNPLLRIFVDEDNCSGIASRSAELWGPGPNGVLNGPGVADDVLLGTVNNHEGPFFNVPLYFNGNPAMYNIVFKATDGCGNQSSATLKVTLRDRVPPVAVCDEITEISVTNNGLQPGQSCSTLHAEDLDDGSYDNCKPVYFLAAKMSAAPSAGTSIFNRCYYPTLDFCCSEVGTTQTVIVLVLDVNPAQFFTTLNVPASGCNGTPGLFLTQGFLNLPIAPNINTCMVQVEVTDKLPPILVNCPAQQRITCDWYAQNLEATLFGIENNSALTAAQKDAQQDAFLTPFFGAPSFYDNCNLVITPQVTLNIDQCLEGRIIRTWTARDNAGNNAQQSCVQTIFVDHVSDFVVEFPMDVTINCGTDVPDFGEPAIFFETCELVAVSFEDQLFTVVSDACFKLVRTWTVINWCVVGAELDNEVIESSELQFQQAFPAEPCDFNGVNGCNNRTFRDSWRVSPKAKPGASNATQQTGPDTDPDTDPWDGYITYQQVIKVQDTVDPVFTNGCAIPDVCINDNSCVATVILPTPEITECSPTVTITVQIQIGGNWIAQGVNGFGPYFNVAPGTYPVRYTAIDNCNNQTVCNTTVRVKDCKLPTPYCKAGIVVELMVTNPPMVEVWAVDLNDNSFDNCPGALKFSFSADVTDIGKIYTCDDFGPNEDTLWVTDAAGNQDFCTTIVNIQANQGQCDDDPQVAGTIATAANQKVEGVDVSINSPSGFTATQVTNAQGQYQFTVPGNNDYTITPVLDVEPLNGVSTFDLVLISKHILGVQALDSPYKLIAADANKSNTVTTFDLVEIRKLILFINTDFPNNTSWRFVPKSYTFANPANPFQTQFPEVINLNDLTADKLANDFVAIKVGDVNGSAAVNLGGANQDRTYNGDLVLNVEDMEVKAGERYTVEFKATEFNVSGYQFTLAFDKEALEFAGVEAGLATEGNFGLTMVDKGIITTSWNAETAKQLAAGDLVFGLTFTAKQSGTLSRMLNLNSRYTAAEAYSAGSELMNVALSFNGQLAANGFALYQNTPNPFANETVIGFYLPEATSATLTISDVQGKVVKIVPGNYAKGYNQVSLKRSELGATGVLYYRLDSGADSATRMMILVD